MEGGNGVGAKEMALAKYPCPFGHHPFHFQINTCLVQG